MQHHPASFAGLLREEWLSYPSHDPKTGQRPGIVPLIQKNGRILVFAIGVERRHHRGISGIKAGRSHNLHVDGKGWVANNNTITARDTVARKQQGVRQRLARRQIGDGKVACMVARAQIATAELRKTVPGDNASDGEAALVRDIDVEGGPISCRRYVRTFPQGDVETRL